RSSYRLFHLVQRLGPVFLHQSREPAIGEQLAARLAGWAVVRFVVRIADALDGSAAHGAWLAELAVHGHLGPKRCDLLRKLLAGRGSQARDPLDERRARGIVQTFRLLVCQARSEHERREPG